LTAVVAASVLGGCGSVPPKEGTTLDHIRTTLDDGAQEHKAAPPAPPAEVSEALLPPLHLATGAAPAQRRFDISVKDMDARDFFMGLVEGTSENMVVHPDVQGKISLSLKNVTLQEVMETLRDVYGYEFEHTASGYQVLPVRLQSRIFQVNYLNMKRKGLSHTRVSSGQVSDAQGGGDSGGEGGDSSGSGAASTSGSDISTESESDFWKGLRTALNTLVGNANGRSVVVSPESGLVVVRAMPAELREVENYLRTTDNAMHRQVILEAKVIEVELKDGYQAGIDWAKIATSHGNSLSLGQSGGGGLFSNGGLGNVDLPRGGINDPQQNSPVGFTDFKSFGGFFGGVLNTGSFMAFIELLKSQGNVQVLSNPRVSTLSNQKAVIKVGTDEFFVTDVSSTTVTGTATTTTPDITLTPFFSGIALDVTPQIDAQGGVTLHVHPSVSNVTDQQKRIKVGDQEQSLPLARSTVRESDSMVYAHSGQLVVIGGLMQEKMSENVTSTPVLGDLPVLGQMFRHTRQGAVKSELVILLRPTVVKDSRTWGNSLRNTSQRIQRLDRGFHYGASPEIFGTRGEAPAR